MRRFKKENEDNKSNFVNYLTKRLQPNQSKKSLQQSNSLQFQQPYQSSNSNHSKSVDDLNNFNDIPNLRQRKISLPMAVYPLESQQSQQGQQQTQQTQQTQQSQPGQPSLSPDPNQRPQRKSSLAAHSILFGQSTNLTSIPQSSSSSIESTSPNPDNNDVLLTPTSSNPNLFPQSPVSPTNNTFDTDVHRDDPPSPTPPNPYYSFNSISNNDKRSSQIILRSGFLQRKIDYTPARKSQAELSRNWKPFKVTLRSNKLFLYKIPSSEKSSAVRDFFPQRVIPSAPIQQQVPVNQKSRPYYGKDKHPSLIIDESATDERVISGSPEAIIHEMIFGTQSNNNEQHYEFTECVLFNYSNFLEKHFNSTRFLNEVQKCSNTALQEAENANYIQLVILPFIIRYLVDIQHLHFDDQGRRILINLVEAIKPRPSTKEHDALIKTVQLNLFNNSNNDHKPTFNLIDYQTKLKSAPSSPQVLRLEVSKHLSTAGLTPALFLVLEPREVARQVHSYHVERMLAIGEYLEGIKNNNNFDDQRSRQESFLIICHQAEDRNPLTALSFSPAKPHFLTRLILHHILILSKQPLNLEGISSLGQLRSLVAATTSSPTALRATLIVHWIRVGMSLERLGDATGWAAVALGLCSRAVSRLARTWKRIGREERDTVSKWASILAELGVVDETETTTEAKVKPATSINNYKISPKSKVRPGLTPNIHVNSAPIPYLGTLLDDVKPTYDGHSVDNIKFNGLYKSRKCLYESYSMFEEALINQCVKISVFNKSSRDTTGDDTNEDEDVNGVEKVDENDKNLINTPRCVNLLVEFGALWQYLSLIPIPQLPQTSLYIGNSLSCESRLLNPTAEKSQLRNQKSDETTNNSPALPSDYKSPTQLSINLLTPLAFPQPLSYISFSDQQSIITEANERLFSANLSAKPKLNRLNSGDDSQIANTNQLPTSQIVRTRSTQMRRRSFDLDLKRKSSRRAIKSDENQSPFNSLEKSVKMSHEPQNRRLAFQRTMKEMAAGGAETIFNLCDGELVIKALPNESFFIKRASFSHRLSAATSTSGQTSKADQNRNNINNNNDDGSRPTSLIESRANSRHASVSNFSSTTGTTGALGRAASFRRQSIIGGGVASNRHSNYSNFSGNNNNEAYLRVFVKSGSLDRLIDVLILGIDHLGVQRTSADDLGGGLEVSVAGKGKIRFAMDLTEYADVFFATFRSICPPIKLFETLQKRFECAPNVSQELSLVASEVHFPTWKSERIPIEQIEWEQVTRVRVGVIDALRFWLEFGGGLQDTLDEQSLFSNLITFLKSGQNILNDHPYSEDQLSSLQTTSRAMKSLYDFFTRQALRPDVISNNEGNNGNIDGTSSPKPRISDTKNDQPLESQQKQSPHKSNTEERTKDILEAASVVENIDKSAPEELVEALDQIGSAILRNISEQDLVATAELFETQVNENEGWFASKYQDMQPQSYSQENVVIQDIYIYVGLVKGDCDLSIARRLPASVRAAHKATMIVRKWATNILSQIDIGLDRRVKRIEMMLDAISICRSRMSTLNSEDNGNSTSKLGNLSSSIQTFGNNSIDVNSPTIRSMVENALVVALISPESRSHVGAWTQVAINRNGDIESLPSFIRDMTADISNPTLSVSPRDRPCAVDLGWIWERMLEVILDVRDEENTVNQYISFDKRRYLFNFSCNAPQLGQQSVLSSEDEGSISFLLQLMDKQSNEMLSRPINNKSNNNNLDNQLSPLGRVHEDASKEVLIAQKKGIEIEQPYAFTNIAKMQEEKEKRDAIIIDKIRREKRDDLIALEKREIEIQKATSMSFLSRHGRTSSSASTNSVGSSSNTSKKSRQGKRMTALLRPFRPLSIAFGSQHTPTDTPRKRLSELDFEPSSKPALVVTLNAARVSEFINNSRSYTFQVISEDGASYLFQGTSSGDVKDWIDVIGKASQSSAAKRLTYIAPSASTTDLHSPQIPSVPVKKEVEAVFGVDIDEVVRREYGEEGIENGQIPIIVDKCIDEIENRGLLETGIYRLSGAISAVSNLKELFDRDSSNVNLNEGDARDIHSVTGALKLYLRELPEPIVPFSMYRSFIQAVLIEEYEEKLYMIRELVWNLPRTHFALLRRLSEHLEKVTDFEDQNQMFAHNLAIVFGPTILKPPAGPGSFMQSMSNIGHVSNLVKIFILQCHWLFYAADEGEVDHNDQNKDNNLSEEQQQQQNRNNSNNNNNVINDDTVIVEEDEDVA